MAASVDVDSLATDLHAKDNVGAHADALAMDDIAISMNTLSISASDLVEEASKSENVFLTLPGEIRNRIYSYAVETLEDTPVLRPEYKPSTLCAGCSQWKDNPCRPPNRRNYFSLTQTCRQIRTEFRPLYHTRTEVHVRSYDIVEYMQTFNGIGMALTRKAKEAIGNIVVMPHQLFRYDFDSLTA
ncbi:hypothetical protein NX059_012004 [Plenodomus lindquistii]|nr:hypothetical protein NX059_012004 [Plenodomus lindquistii]